MEHGLGEQKGFYKLQVKMVFLLPNRGTLLKARQGLKYRDQNNPAGPAKPDVFAVIFS